MAFSNYSNSKLKIALTSCLLLLFVLVQEGKCKVCDDLIPGIDKMIKGVDIISFDVLPLAHPQNQMLKKPILKASCDKGYTWKDNDGKIRDFPDQLAMMSTVPGGTASMTTTSYKTTKEVRDWMNVNVAVEGTISAFSFSASTSYKKMEEALTETSKFIQDVSSVSSSYRADFNPYFSLEMDKYAMDFINREFSAPFEKNPRPYIRFIQQYGTHFMSQANFGGVLRLHLETDTSLLKTKTDEDIQANAEAAFSTFVYADVGFNKKLNKQEEEFKESTKEKRKYYGGASNNLEKDGWKKWQSSVDSNPWLMKCKLHPISDLIKDETKRKNMEIATTQWAMRSFVDELERQTKIAKEKHNKLPIFDQLLKQIEKQKKKRILQESTMLRLRELLDYHLVVPRWFSEETSLCFKADCKTKKNSLPTTCARVNTATSDYLDDTNIKTKECTMNWGLFTRNNPEWFNEVKLCFRYVLPKSAYSYRKPIYCSGLEYQCIAANKFTFDHIDQSAGENGGCSLQWSIKAPDNAPVWFKKSKLCMFYQAMGPARQCNNNGGNGGKRQSLCAEVGKETYLYRDLTNDKFGHGGGCKMSWGIFTAK